MTRARMLGIPALALLMGLLVACSGVPASSKPDVLRRGAGIAGTGAVDTDTGPSKGILPQQLVLDFLNAAVTSVSAARLYLTADAQRRWQNQTATAQTATVLRNRSVHQPTGTSADGLSTSVQVDGDLVGAVTDGSFKPQPQVSLQATIGLQKVNDQWRISSPPPASIGLLINESDIGTRLKAYPIYFLDPSGTHLVPDLRYSALTGQGLATWLLQQLVAGPGPDLASAVVSELPDQTGARLTATITNTNTVDVDYPGALQLDPAVVRRLAVQLAYTFDNLDIPFQAGMTLTDAARPVSVPGIGTTFDRSDFQQFSAEPSQGQNDLYYVQNDGGVVDETNHRKLPGVWGSGALHLASVAVTSQGALTGVQVAAVSQAAQGSQLYLGLSTGGAVSKLTGVTSRPEWQPRATTPTAWVGRGSQLFRIVAGGAPQEVPILLASSSPLQGKPIQAVRFSPDGTRLAVLAANAVYVGSLVTAAGAVRAQNFTLITQSSTAFAISVLDIAFESSTELWMIASLAHDPHSQVYPVGIDGQGLNSADLVSRGGALSSDPVQLASPGGPLVIATGDLAIWSIANPESSQWTQVDLGGSAPAYGS